MPAAISRYSDHTARWSAIALGFSIPLTVALNNVFLAFTLLAWLLGGGYREKLAAFRNPAAIPAIALFALTALGILYSQADLDAAALHLKKYIDLMLIPVFLYVFRDADTRRHGLIAFAISLAFILALSYLLKLGVPLRIPAMLGDAGYPVVFKKHLTHNILVAFAVFLFAWLALDARSARGRVGWSVLAILAFFNVTVMIHGATGYLVLGGLLLLLGYRCIGWRGLGAGSLGIAVMGLALMSFTNPFQQRVTKIAAELQEWRPDRPAANSTGWRLEFYQTTLAIISDQPLTGVGTGGFPSTYAAKVQGTGKVATENPHNEFLFVWAQLGIAGLVVFIWMFARQWRLAERLPTRLESELARGLVATMVIGCMLNSLLLDHTEGLFYAWLTGMLYGGLKYRGAENAARTEARVVSEAPIR